MLYFKEPAINKQNYTETLENINKTLSKKPTRIHLNEQEPVQSIRFAIDELIKIHVKEFGEQQTKQDLRLLGNAIRIASQSSQDTSSATQEIIWGIDANALDFMSSGESSCLSEALKYIKRKVVIPTIFDIGANKGRWSKFAISNLNTFSLHIFEPNTSLKEELTNNIKISMAKANPNAEAHLNMLGVGSQDHGSLYVNSISDELATTVLNAGKPIYSNYETVKIKLVKGGDYCHTKNIDRIDYLKIDTEGSELAALKTFEALIREGKINFIQFEYGKPSLYGSSILNSFFEALNSKYTIHRILPEGITDKLKYSEELETFAWSNYLAILKENLDFLDQFSTKSTFE